MSKSVKGDKKVDIELQKLSKYLVDVVAEKKKQLDMETCLVLISRCSRVVKIAGSVMRTRIAQVISGKDTAAKKLKKRK